MYLDDYPDDSDHDLRDESTPYIWTNEVAPLTKSDEESPTVVFVHGYGGAGLVFVKLMEHLPENYHMYSVDLLGMGRSA